MGTKNLSKYNQEEIPSAQDMKFGIVVSEWNPEVTMPLLNGAVDCLKNHGTKESDILVKHVPGSFELTKGAKLFAEYSNVDAIIVIGCVIQGETRHFDFICQSVSYGITELNLKYPVPVIFGVLTTQNQQQAIDRAGGKHGNKGVECAVAAIKMVNLKRTF